MLHFTAAQQTELYAIIQDGVNRSIPLVFEKVFGGSDTLIYVTDTKGRQYAIPEAFLNVWQRLVRRTPGSI